MQSIMLTDDQLEFVRDDDFSMVWASQAGGGKSTALTAAAIRGLTSNGGLHSLLIVPSDNEYVYDEHVNRVRNVLEDISVGYSIKSSPYHTEVNFDNGSVLIIERMATTLETGYNDAVGDLKLRGDGPSWYRWAGAQFQFIGIDHLQLFPVEAYLYLATRCRKSHESKDVPRRIRGCYNGSPAMARTTHKRLLSALPTRMFRKR